MEAATRNPSYAAWVGALTAREGRAIGFHWTFAPVADVNNNPDNPIINIRSFGEDPEIVSTMVDRYVRANQAAGMIATEFSSICSINFFNCERILQMILPQIVQYENADIICQIPIRQI